jgi:NADH pyrophosphatase NudC (nudix superfamily)
MNKYKKSYFTIEKELKIANIMLPNSLHNFKELVKRATPIKVKRVSGSETLGYCKCKNLVKITDDSNFCGDCGQKLDWSDE